MSDSPKRTYRRLNGRFKRCDCPRRIWPKCAHPVWGKFLFKGQDIRVNLATQFEKPSVSWAEAVGLLDIMRGQIRAGTFVKYGTPPPTPTVTPALASVTGLTLWEAADRFIEERRLDPTRRTHRWSVDRQSLNSTLRTLVEGVPFGDMLVEAVRTPDLEKWREGDRISRRPHFLGGWGQWDVQVGFRRRCVSAPSGW